MKTHLLRIREPFTLECGQTLPALDIAYGTSGKLNERRDNVVWICHALTANADPTDWWEGLVGYEKLFDPERHFIVCANILGSCYGSTGPGSTDPRTGSPYGRDWPLITIRDMVRAHQLLQRELGIEKIYLAIGGSMGGQQAMEWAIADPGLFEHLCLLACNARHSPWGIAFNEAQRMALEADPTLYDGNPGAGSKGLEAARAIALLSYRNYPTYCRTQQDASESLQDFRATSYQRYQGQKLSRRFSALAYLSLTRSMDSHHVGRDREGIAEALRRIRARTLVVGIQSDILFPVEEQALLAAHIPGARLEVMDSPYGHDGFLIEYAVLEKMLSSFLDYPASTTDTHPRSSAR